MKKLAKQGKDFTELEAVLQLLIKQIPLPDKYRDHALVSTNKYYRVRECHIQPDWLLVYRINEVTIKLIDTGSHSALF